jgi:hypothetical protein
VGSLFYLVLQNFVHVTKPESPDARAQKRPEVDRKYGAKALILHGFSLTKVKKEFNLEPKLENFCPNKNRRVANEGSPMPSKSDEQKTRRALAGSTSTVTTSTLRDHVDSESGGRFTELGRREGASKPTIVGADSAVVRYPAGPNWSGADSGLEPPLGFSINDMEPVGLAHEVEASEIALAELATASSTTLADSWRRGIPKSVFL